MVTSWPKKPSLSRRTAYSRWMYRHGDTTTSSCATPLTTSNGVIDNAPGSSWLSTGTTVIGPVSMTLQVRTRPNFSPTRTDVRSAFHQQRIGSDSTSPGFAARGVIAGPLAPAGRGGGGAPCGTTTGAGRAGRASVVCAWTGTPGRTRPTTTTASTRMSAEPLILITSS